MSVMLMSQIKILNHPVGGREAWCAYQYKLFKM